MQGVKLPHNHMKVFFARIKTEGLIAYFSFFFSIPSELPIQVVISPLHQYNSLVTGLLASVSLYFQSILHVATELQLYVPGKFQPRSQRVLAACSNRGLKHSLVSR